MHTAQENTPYQQSQISIPQQSNRELVVNALKSNGSLSARAVEKITGLTPVQVRYVLRNEIKKQTIEMLGSQGNKNTRYRLIQKTR